MDSPRELQWLIVGPDVQQARVRLGGMLIPGSGQDPMARSGR